MSNKNRKKIDIERDRRNISRMYLQGMLQAEIAEELGVSQSTVSRDLSYIQKQWQQERINNVDERKRIELAKIDNLELEYWEAWKHSLENAEVQTVEKQGIIHDKDGKIIGSRVKQIDRQEGQAGDPRFLQGIQWCIEKRCELLGLDAPKKTDLTSDGKPVAVNIYIPDNSRNDSSK